jgi:hypothetical protein
VHGHAEAALGDGQAAHEFERAPLLADAFADLVALDEDAVDREGDMRVIRRQLEEVGECAVDLAVEDLQLVEEEAPVQLHHAAEVLRPLVDAVLEEDEGHLRVQVVNKGGHLASQSRHVRSQLALHEGGGADGCAEHVRALRVVAEDLLDAEQLVDAGRQRPSAGAARLDHVAVEAEGLVAHEHAGRRGDRHAHVGGVVAVIGETEGKGGEDIRGASGGASGQGAQLSVFRAQNCLHLLVQRLDADAEEQHSERVALRNARTAGAKLRTTAVAQNALTTIKRNKEGQQMANVKTRHIERSEHFSARDGVEGVDDIDT